MPAPGPALLDQPMVAIDLETTGLDPARDRIIEIGAVRFQADLVLETYTTPVNPRRAVPDFITRLTGITQAEVEASPLFAQEAPRLVEFVGSAPVVGHNVSFDLAFLGRSGVRFTSPVFDTRELASVLIPGGPYSLGLLAKSLGVGPWQAHRALGDAQATHRVLMALVRLAQGREPGLVAELVRLSRAGELPMAILLESVMALQGRGRGTPGGLDLESLERRATPAARPLRRSRPPTRPEPVPVEELASLVQPGGALAAVVAEYEHRPEQEAMLRAVAQALTDGAHLAVEAGTGVGKSMAYLLPAAWFALKNGLRVVVSTNTINLQEQLVVKDMPAAAAALGGLVEGDAVGFRAVVLKGRGNYLCLRRWGRMRLAERLPRDDALLMGKLACWLPETAAGDRAELSLARPEVPLWGRLSAQGSRECPPEKGFCFLRAARERAEGAHVVVVNHALLLADLQAGGGLLPAYDHLVVDEAHHLEAEATRQMGASLSHEQVQEAVGALSGPRGLAAEAVEAYMGSGAAEGRRQATERASAAVAEAAGTAAARTDALFSSLGRFLHGHAESANGERGQLLVTEGARDGPAWRDLMLAWENASSALSDLRRRASALHASLDGQEHARLRGYEALMDDLAASEGVLGDILAVGQTFFDTPDDGSIYWMEAAQGGLPTLQVAPLRVGEILRERLFDKKRSVVLTSATLSVAGDFGPVVEALGCGDAETLLLGSPFDYRRAARVLVPRDMPEPGAPGYAATVAETVAALARASGGRTMALFTSHAALRSAASALREMLAPDDLRVLAQGVDGSPAQLLGQFMDDARGVLLGAASFWEGVDMAGEALSVLVVARLPFDVPTEPVFAARSALHENPFMGYAVPRAVLRFRQGFGRLIRRGTDRGVVVVLDKRLTGRSYGSLFLRALPPCDVARPSLAELPAVAARWLRAEG